MSDVYDGLRLRIFGPKKAGTLTFQIRRCSQQQLQRWQIQYTNNLGNNKLSKKKPVHHKGKRGREKGKEKTLTLPLSPFPQTQF
ncbi:hypothetical protein [Nostoc sp. DedQUE09]|uniref:hypothetical protein n=1 Tax=Nostoc sp. DedQUE09 TaxID=3075394 RepID=UPI002AD26CBA|nr:hypothetical protein [Nostoc sp. DedQUE09]MDZ7950931.1 hypothetical protein [Nostoc sp. DedQUE09]